MLNKTYPINLTISLKRRPMLLINHYECCSLESYSTLFFSLSPFHIFNLSTSHVGCIFQIYWESEKKKQTNKNSLLYTALILILAIDHSLLDDVTAFWLVCLFTLCPPAFLKTAGKVFLSRWEADDVTLLRILPMVFYLIQSKTFFQWPVRSFWPCYFSKIPSHLLSPLIFLFQSCWHPCSFCEWPALPPWGLCTCNSFC